MGFTTKLDFSSNRQVKQHIETFTVLSGGTSFGIPFSSLPTGPNLTTTGVTNTLSNLLSTFSGNLTTTIYTWYDPAMNTGLATLSAITPTNSGVTQNALGYSGSSYLTIDGNTVATAYSGVSFDLTPITMYDLGGGNYSGSVQTNYLDYLSASSLDFTGRTIWNDVSGITRTQDLIITNNPVIGNVWTCVDIEGKGAWTSVSGGTGIWIVGGGLDAVMMNNGGNVSNGHLSIAEGANNQALGNESHSEGNSTQALGAYSHAEGLSSIASGSSSHAQGYYTQANGDNSHAEGDLTIASGENAHAEGDTTIASGYNSHAGGMNTIASGSSSFVHGSYSTAGGNNTIVLGANITGLVADTTYVDRFNIKTLGGGTSINNLGIDSGGNIVVGSGSGSTLTYWSAGTGLNSIVVKNSDSVASGDYSLAAGRNTLASSDYCFAEGRNTIASQTAAHAEGYNTKAFGQYSHAEGVNTTAYTNSHAEGLNTIAYSTSHAEGWGTISSGQTSHAEGLFTQANGEASHAEGRYTQANGYGSHAEGQYSIANGYGSHAEGSGSTTNGYYTHAEGHNTLASDYYSHAEGDNTIASGTSSHAEGGYTVASGNQSHAEGFGSIASGQTSHAQGYFTIASGAYGSHAGGTNTIASGYASFVHGDNSQAVGSWTIVLGANITGNTNNTTYVDHLNIKTVGSGAFANNINIDATGNLTTSTSDERLKENILPLSGALSTIKALQGVSFQWKDRNAGTDAIRIGFIAQQVDKVDSRLTFTNKVDGYMGIHTDSIIPLLVEAVKELSNGVTTSNNTHLETQTILAEDNNIDLNYSGTPITALGGGITVLHAMGVDNGAEFITDENGNWTTNNDFIPNKITIPIYSPSGSTDTNGNLGNVTRDEDYLYIKSSTGWKRTNLESF